VPVADEFVPVLRRWGIDDSRVAVIPNWAPLDEVRPLPGPTAWSLENGLRDHPILLYAGTLGRKHDAGLLVRLADSLDQATLVVIAEGTGTDQLRRMASTRANVRFLPLQPLNRLAEALASADVLLAVLEPEASEFSVPSKVLTYLAAGRSILAAISPENPAARLIVEAGAGIVVRPRNEQEFIAAARRLVADADLRSRLGASGRSYAEREFNIESLADRFAGVLTTAAERALHPGRTVDTSGVTSPPGSEDSCATPRRRQSPHRGSPRLHNSPAPRTSAEEDETAPAYGRGPCD
jgi:glycosyltransferase involved in cell wall biosynthesis